MHHRQESNSTREGKLRAACDRCHDLKNRCVRTGGSESRCDRCERLNIDCVYRTNSRTGRPRVHRGPPAPETAPTRDFRGDRDGDVERRTSYPTPTPTTSTTTKARKIHARRLTSSSSGNTSSPDGSTDAVGLSGDFDQNDVERRQSCVGQTPEMLVLGVNAPEELLEWSLDFSPHIHVDMASSIFDETMFPDPRGQDAGAFPESEAFSFLTSENTRSAPIARCVGTTTEKLLRLQINLHQLSVNTELQPNIEQPAAEEVLEATKGFLEILQASLAAQDSTLTPALQEASTGDDPKPPAMSYITVLQVLTCYSYVLQLLDPVVGALMTQKADAAARGMGSCSVHSNAGPKNCFQTSLSIGLFNLASQPAMNADVVLHIILRMIQQLRVSIHLLASGHRELTGEIFHRVGRGSGAGAVDTAQKLHTTPISISSQPIIDLISAREEPLVEKLNHLMSGQ